MAAFNLRADCVKRQPKEDLSDPSPDSSKRACSPARSPRRRWAQEGGRSRSGGRGGRRRGGRRSEGPPVRARANRSALCQRPITSRLARQICPAVPGGAAGSPGPPVTLLSACWKPGAGGTCAEEPGRALRQVRLTGQPRDTHESVDHAEGGAPGRSRADRAPGVSVCRVGTCRVSGSRRGCWSRT